MVLSLGEAWVVVGMESGPRWQIEDDTTGRGGEEGGEEAGMEIFLMLMWSLTWRILLLAEERGERSARFSCSIGEMELIVSSLYRISARNRDWWEGENVFK